jgi:hypothetical protein
VSPGHAGDAVVCEPDDRGFAGGPCYHRIDLLSFHAMPRATPKYARSQVDAAGDTLIRLTNPGTWEEQVELDNAQTIINNWRAAHRFPLNSMQVTLRGRALKIDPKAVIPQRLKRLPAIESKLRLHEGMKLSRMHDIGGCRAILKDVKAVNRLVEKYDESNAKNPHTRARFVRKYDYIDGLPGPKTDGYRGVHLVYRYRSESEELSVFNGLRIEIQVRSQPQHVFATAVETASIFTEQPIKSLKANLDDERWRRFFALMGGALAIREETAPVPNVPTARDALVAEIKDLSGQLSVETVLGGWGKTVENLSGKYGFKNAVAYILRLDADTKTTEVIAYSEKELPTTDDDYLKMEKLLKQKPSHQVVWVKAESIDALRLGYPNFYLDTAAFIDIMKEIIAKGV